MARLPGWIKDLADSSAVYLVPTDILAPIGCHYCRVGDVWEISLFVSRTEIVGGEYDGSQRGSKFILDVPALMELFESVPDVQWQAQSHGEDYELGPHLALIGIYAGHKVCLQILADAPLRFAPGRRAAIYTNTIEDCW